MSEAVEKTDVRHIADLPSVADLLHPSGLANETYEELFGQQERVLRVQADKVLMFRYEDMRKFGSDPRFGNVPTEEYVKRVFLASDNTLEQTDVSNLKQYQSNQFFTANPGNHRVLKPIFASSLSQRRMPEYATLADDIVDDLISQIVPDEVDLFQTLALPLSFGLWAKIFEMSDEEVEAMRELIPRLGPIVGSNRTKHGIREANAAIAGYLDTFSTAIRRAQSDASNIFLEGLEEKFLSASVEADGRPDDLETFIAANLIDGFHAMTVGINSALVTLVQQPDLLLRLHADESLADDIVTETLRLNSPVPTIMRRLNETVIVDGVELPEGTAVVMHWHAANRDPEIYERPEHFILERQRKSLMTFGTGAQICPGRNITRTLALVVTKAVSRHKLRLELAGELKWAVDNPAVHKPYALNSPVRLRTH